VVEVQWHGRQGSEPSTGAEDVAVLAEGHPGDLATSLDLGPPRPQRLDSAGLDGGAAGLVGLGVLLVIVRSARWTGDLR